MIFAKIFALAFIASSALGHMLMSYPPALRYKDNHYSGDSIDDSLTNPLSSFGSDFPCRGNLNLLGTVAATSVASRTAGKTYNVTISGGATHSGGSC